MPAVPAAGAATTVPAVPWDEDADDEPAGLGQPLPQDDRLWRHPSELGPSASGATTTALAVSADGATWPAVAAAALAGAVITAAVMAVTGALPARVIEERVVEKVAMTPVVSSPLVQGERGVDALAAQVSASIVRIDVRRGAATTSVSGVLFRDDGLILTSAGPLSGERTTTVVLADGRRFDGEVLGVDAPTDIAVVQIDGEHLPVAVLGTTERVRVGEPTVTIGSPQGYDRAFVVTGVVSATASKVATGDGRWLHGLIQTDSPVSPGCLGGALVDTGGAVIGIVTAQAVDPDDDFGFATPIALAHRVGQQLAHGGRAVHGWLGIAGTDLSAHRAATLGVSGGAVVREVTPGGPAATAGLRTGDVITDVDGRSVASMSALVVEMRDHEPGNTVLVGYRRDGRHHEATIPVSATP